MQPTPPNLVIYPLNRASCYSFLTYFSSVKQLLSSMKMKSLNSSLMRQKMSKTNSAARGQVCFWLNMPDVFDDNAVFYTPLHISVMLFHCSGCILIVFLSCVLCRPLWPRSKNTPWRTLISSLRPCFLSSAEMETLGAVVFWVVTYRRFMPWQRWKMYATYYVK